MPPTVFERAPRDLPADDPLTERVRATWSAGDFGRIARGYVYGSAEFIARLELERGERVLDVACGTGNLAIPAARTGAVVTGIDIAPNLIAQARAGAKEERLSIRFEIGDAEQLPYESNSFDTVVTMFGAMFAARPERAANELLRVTRPGGRIAMANWTPTGFVGQMFKATAAYIPTPTSSQARGAGASPERERLQIGLSRAPASSDWPLSWGSEDAVRARLGANVSALGLTRRLMTFEYPFGPEQVVNEFRLWYGPTLRTFAALEEEQRTALRLDLERLWWEHNRATDGTTRVESEYLEVLAVVR